MGGKNEMHVLILSANTGGGHNSVAQALIRSLEDRGHTYEVTDALTFISPAYSKFISWGHTFSYRFLPHLFGVCYRYEERHPIRFIYRKCAKGADALAEKLRACQPDAVICCHVFASLMITELQKRYGKSVPCYFIATDYTCSPGVSDIVNDAYFIPHGDLTEEFRRALPHGELVASGIPIDPRFYSPVDRELAKRELGLPADKRIVLLSAGSMGCGNLVRKAHTLSKGLPEDACLVVLCGKNGKVHRKLSHRASDRLIPVSYTNKVPLYLSAATLSVTKPGGLTVTESIAMRVPLFFFDAVPGLETRNFDFLIARGVAGGAEKWSDLIGLIRRALDEPAQLDAQIRAMQSFSMQNAADAVILRVCGQAGGE